MSAIPSPLSPFVARSHDLSNIVFGANVFLAAVARLTGQMTTLLLYPVLAIVMPFFGLFLNFQYQKLKRLYRGSRAVETLDYTQIRTEMEVLDAALDKIAGFRADAENKTSSPFLLRGIAAQTTKLYGLIHQRRDSLAHMLAGIDASAPRTDILTPRSEADIWSSRNPAYQFRF